MNLIESIIYFLIGVIPCLLWLFFYLSQDVHPESNKKIIEIFLLGALTVVPIKMIENYATNLFPPENILVKKFMLLLLYYGLIIGFTEEFFKYLVVRLRVIKSSHFDEPIDAMLYLIIASLGLATVENLAVVFGIKIIPDIILVSIIRLLTAIFLHTLAAAITGFFLAFCLREKNLIKRSMIVIGGLLIASFCHGIYDISILKLETANNIFYFFLPIAIIFLMGIFVYFLFSKVKKIPRSCNL